MFGSYKTCFWQWREFQVIHCTCSRSISEKYGLFFAIKTQLFFHNCPFSEPEPFFPAQSKQFRRLRLRISVQHTSPTHTNTHTCKQVKAVTRQVIHQSRGQVKSGHSALAASPVQILALRCRPRLRPNRCERSRCKSGGRALYSAGPLHLLPISVRERGTSSWPSCLVTTARSRPRASGTVVSSASSPSGSTPYRT